MIIFVGVELVIIGICILIAKNMINNRSGWAKDFVIGKDDEETIKEMQRIVKEVVSDGKVQVDDTLEGCKVKIEIKNGCIITIKVETSRTRLIYNLVDHEKRIENRAWSKRGATTMLTFMLWIFSFLIQIIVVLLGTVITTV